MRTFPSACARSPRNGWRTVKAGLSGRRKIFSSWSPTSSRKSRSILVILTLEVALKRERFPTERLHGDRHLDGDGLAQTSLPGVSSKPSASSCVWALVCTPAPYITTESPLLSCFFVV